MWIVLGVVVVCGVIVLEVAVTMRSHGAVVEAREEAEDWRTVAENLSQIAKDQWPRVLWPDGETAGYQEDRYARVSMQLDACREAYPR
jgi:hypothetical protein